jgi:dTDP-4-dehydrorhamnose reductase
MLGRCVGRQLDTSAIKWIGTDWEIDIADRDAVMGFIAERRPQAIINCAAYTAVDAAETDESNAMRTNGLGPTVLAEASLSIGARFVHVSTDYVLDGERLGEHAEESPVSPCNVYGHTKLAGEIGIVQVFNDASANGRFSPWFVVRTSWLFGSGRSSFVDTMWTLMLEKPELRVVNDQLGRPTYARDLARFLVALANPQEQPLLESGLWHFANSGSTSWYGFANEIYSCMVREGLAVTVKKIHPVSTAEFPRPAKRPKNSVLSTQRIEAHGIIPRNWRDALAEYIQQRVVL